MQIAQVQLGNIIYPLAEGQPLPIKAGEVIRVSFTFKGRVAQTAEVRVWASLHNYVLGILNRQEKAQTKGTMMLERATELTDYPGTIDITIGSINAGSYGLIVELPDYDVEGHIDDCLEVAAPPSIFEAIIPLVMLGLLMFIMPKFVPEKGA